MLSRYHSEVQKNQPDTPFVGTSDIWVANCTAVAGSTLMRRAKILMALMVAAISLRAQQDFPVPQDEPGQPVARVSVLNGEASVRRGDSEDWVAAALNAPLLVSDSISVAPGAQAEIQLDYANFVRLGGDSQVRISGFDEGRYQIQVSRGIVTYRILRDSAAQIEVSTPLVAVHPLRFAAVRVEVGIDGSARVIVRRGEAEGSTPRGTERLREGGMMLVRGAAGDPEYQVVAAPPRDAWDSWNDQRDSWLERAQSNRYVSRDVYGAEDLDTYGRWSYDPAYGNVWAPNVPAAWAPYRDGQWVWEDFYGWTWVPYEPWGWAPAHYGSWYFRTGYGWSWFPGQRYGRAWWRPAMVSFFGFGNGFGNIGWVALAPHEPFHPWYGRGGTRNIFIDNVHNSNVINVHRNARVVNGVTAVTSQDFQRGAFRNTLSVSPGQLQQVSLVRGALPVTPGVANLRFTGRDMTAGLPRAETGSQRFFSRMDPGAGTAPRIQRIPFVRQQAAVPSALGDPQGFRGGTGPISSGQVPAAGGGWRRFGEPAGAPVNSAGSAAAPVRANSAGGWERFGSPSPGGQERFVRPELSKDVPARSAPYAYPQPQQGNDSRYPAANHAERSLPPLPARQGFANGGSARSVQVAPPIVQQRYQPGPAYRNAPAQGDRGGGNRPSDGRGRAGGDGRRGRR